MGIFDKVKKILFDEEEIDETLPIRTDEIEKEQKRLEKEEQNDRLERSERHEEKPKGGVVFHNYEEDTITEVKVPEEKTSSFVFPVKVDDDDFEEKEDTVQMRLKEDGFDRTNEIEKVREERLTKSKEDLINEYNEIRRVQREVVEPRREPIKPTPVVETEKVPYKVPPVISPVFGVLDKNYDPDEYEETRQKITMTNSGNSKRIEDRQFGPVSFNDQGIPVPKYHKETVIITNDPSAKNFIKEELLREKETMKEVDKIEEEIINNILSDDTDASIEDFMEDTKEINKIEEIPEEVIEEEEEPTIEMPKIIEDEDVVEEDEDAVITGSPYDDLIDEELQPSKDIDDLIQETEEEEADVTPEAPKNLDDNVNLDDTIETDLYNLIDSMYKDEE